MAFEDDYDPRLMREFMSQIQNGGKLTEELNDEIKRSNTSFAKLRKGALDVAANTFKEVAGNSKDLATGLIGGKRGFDALNPAIDLAAGALTAMTSWIPYLGKAVESTASLVAEGSKLMLSQIQMQVDAFQQVGEVGALGADGLKGLQKQFLASGLTLESYTRAIQNSSQSLARFRGLTGQGAEDFSIIVGSLTQSTDLGLRRIGLSADQMGESTEAFLSRQTRIGLSQGLTNEVLAQSTTSYIKELDILSKVTGLSRKDIQNQQDQALNESRFAASIQAMRGTSEEGAINSIMNFQSAISGLDTELGAGMRDLASGFTATAAARRAEQATNGQASVIMQRLRTGQINEIQARAQMKDALLENREQILFAGRSLGSDSIFGDVAGLVNVMTTEMDANGKYVKLATDAQKGQIGGTNKLTNEVVSAQQAIEKMQIELQELFFLAMPKAATMTKKFTTTMADGIARFNDLLSGKETLSENDVDAKKSIYNYSGSTGNTAADILNSLSENNAAKSSYPEATKNLLAAGVTPHSDIVKVAMVEGVHGAKKVAGAKDNDLVSSVLGIEAVMKYGATTIGELKNKIAEVDIPTSGPKQTYSSMTASLDTLPQPETTEIENKKQSRAMENQEELLKEQISKMDQMIAVLTQNNSTSRKILSSSYS
jgi:hypothetical protein